MQFDDLTPEVRLLMAEEVKNDVAAEHLYFSPQLSEKGIKEYAELLLTAVSKHDAKWLEGQIQLGGRMKAFEQYRTSFGGTGERRVEANAAEILATEEFNRYYCRGVCVLAIQSDPEAEVQVYRAKDVWSARAASTKKIGTLVKADAFLKSLRENPGVDTALELVAGPISGLSVRIPRKPPHKG